MAHGDGAGFAEVQTATAHIAAERQHFGFDVVVAGTQSPRANRIGAELELFGIDVDGRIRGVIHNAATCAGDADRAPWRCDIILLE